jgi:hypothetical protein
MALFAGAARPASTPLSDRDFLQLMNAAVATASAPSQLQPLTSTICVARELGAPLQARKADVEIFATEGKGASPPPTGDAGADQSIDAAMSPTAVVAHQTSMPALPRKYLLVDAELLPPECVIPRTLGRGPNWKHDESIVVLTFTRPALANGYAYIEEYEACAGLCGTTFLRVFRKQNGKWTQVARTILSVS